MRSDTWDSESFFCFERKNLRSSDARFCIINDFIINKLNINIYWISYGRITRQLALRLSSLMRNKCFSEQQVARWDYAYWVLSVQSNWSKHQYDCQLHKPSLRDWIGFIESRTQSIENRNKVELMIVIRSINVTIFLVFLQRHLSHRLLLIEFQFVTLPSSSCCESFKSRKKSNQRTPITVCEQCFPKWRIST